MMGINFKKWVANMLVIELRTTSVFSFVYAFIGGIIHLYNKQLDFDKDVSYKLQHTSQVWAIEKVLNDALDPFERRIYLSNIASNEIVPLQRDTDLEPLILQDDGTLATPLYPDSGYEGSDYDFVVKAPLSLSDNELYKLKALVNYYKLAGKRYDII